MEYWKIYHTLPEISELSLVYSQTTITGDIEVLLYVGDVQEISEKLNQISTIHYRKKISFTCILSNGLTLLIRSELHYQWKTRVPWNCLTPFFQCQLCYWRKTRVPMAWTWWVGRSVQSAPVRFVFLTSFSKMNRICPDPSSFSSFLGNGANTVINGVMQFHSSPVGVLAGPPRSFNVGG